MSKDYIRPDMKAYEVKTEGILAGSGSCTNLCNAAEDSFVCTTDGGCWGKEYTTCLTVCPAYCNGDCSSDCGSDCVFVPLR